MNEKTQPPADKSGLIDGAKFDNVPTPGPLVVGSANIQPTAGRTIAVVANELEKAAMALVTAELAVSDGRATVTDCRARLEALNDEMRTLLGRKPRARKGT